MNTDILLHPNISIPCGSLTGFICTQLASTDRLANLWKKESLFFRVNAIVLQYLIIPAGMLFAPMAAPIDFVCHLFCIIDGKASLAHLLALGLAPILAPIRVGCYLRGCHGQIAPLNYTYSGEGLLALYMKDRPTFDRLRLRYPDPEFHDVWNQLYFRAACAGIDVSSIVSKTYGSGGLSNYDHIKFLVQTNSRELIKYVASNPCDEYVISDLQFYLYNKWRKDADSYAAFLFDAFANGNIQGPLVEWICKNNDIRFVEGVVAKGYSVRNILPEALKQSALNPLLIRCLLAAIPRYELPQTLIHFVLKREIWNNSFDLVCDLFPCIPDTTHEELVCVIQSSRMLQVMLEGGLNPNQHVCGVPLLAYFMIKSGAPLGSNEFCVDVLLSHTRKPNLEFYFNGDRHGLNTPLAYAIKALNQRWVTLLLKAGADITMPIAPGSACLPKTLAESRGMAHLFTKVVMAQAVVRKYFSAELLAKDIDPKFSKLKAFRDRVVNAHNLYMIFGLPESCNRQELANAFKVCSLQLHPDKCGPEEQPIAAEFFKGMKNVYDSLKAERRWD